MHPVIRVPPKRGGWLEVVCGPMFSGKSEEMIRRLRRAEIAGQRVVIFKPRIDDRYDAADIVSHAGVRMRAVAVDSVAGHRRGARPGVDVVGIDEVQFFDRSIVEAALALADGGARVIVAGLDQDFRRQPFGPMPELLALRRVRRQAPGRLPPLRRARRRRRSASSTAAPPRTAARRSSSAPPTPTRPAAATATSPAPTPSARSAPAAYRRGLDPTPDHGQATNAPAATSTIVPPGGRSP